MAGVALQGSFRAVVGRLLVAAGAWLVAVGRLLEGAGLFPPFAGRLRRLGSSSNVSETVCSEL